MRHDPLVIKMQVEQLLGRYPELIEDEMLRADMIEGETDLNEFVHDLVIKYNEASANEWALNMMIAKWAEREKRFSRRQEALRKLMFNLMQSAGLKKMEFPEATLSIRHGQQWAIVTQQEIIPDEYWRVKREPDKTKIRGALLNGTQVPGATLSNAEPILAMMTK